MKILHYIGTILTLFVIFQSCKKDETQARLATGDGVKAAVLTLDKTDLTLSKESASDTVLHLSLVPADFGFQAAVANVLQIGLKGDDFKTVKEVAIPNGQNAIGFTGYELNSYLLALGAPTGEVSEFDIRLKSSINAKIEAVYSVLSGLKASPYASTSYLYAIGAYEDWVEANAAPLISPTSNGIYTGIINFPEEKLTFKLTPERNWNNSYGETESGKIVYNGGQDIKAPKAGTLEIEANTNANTITYSDISWGIIGSGAKGWGDLDDVKMEYENANQVWKATVVLTAGEIKFRKNGTWDTNFGGANGSLVAGGDNIAVANAGTYDIIVDFNANTYTLTKK